MHLKTVPYDHPDAVELIAELQGEYVARYGGIDRTVVDPAEFAPPSGLFLVGYEHKVPVACGGWRTVDASVVELSAGPPGDGPAPAASGGAAEIKRMYVVAPARGRGLARRLLGVLERTIAQAGFGWIVLESGAHQPEALQLYRTSGYHAIQPYGLHRCSPDSRCFAKSLLDGEQPGGRL